MTERIDSPAWTRKDSKVLQVLASVLAQQRRERQAAVILEFVQSTDPDNTEVFKGLAALYLELGRFEECLEMADRSLAVVTDQSEEAALRLVRCHALWGLGQTTASQAEMDIYIQWRKSI